MRVIQLVTGCGVVLSTVAAAGAQTIDWAKIDATFGRGAAVAGEVHRYGFPRTDLQVTLDGVTIGALGIDLVFKPDHDYQRTAKFLGVVGSQTPRLVFGSHQHSQTQHATSAIVIHAKTSS